MKTNRLFLAFIALVMALNGLGMAWAPALAADETLVKSLEFGKEYDLVLKEFGFYTPTSAVASTLEMIWKEQIDTTMPFKTTGMQFVGHWADISMFDKNGKEFSQVFGLDYLYFNLDEASRKLYNEGRLSIYRWVAEDKDWEQCDALIFRPEENKPNGRLACIISDFGTYTLASAPAGQNSEIDGAKISSRLEFSKRYDIYVGDTGVFTPRSAFTGRMEFITSAPDNTKAFSGRTFNSQWVDVRIYNNSTGKQFKRAYGLIYVYFNMTAADRALYDKGKLSIYQWDDTEDEWTACPVVILVKTENKPDGRLACVIKNFGLYTLAAKP